MKNINNKSLLAVILLVFMSAGYILYKGYSNEKRTLVNTTDSINEHLLKHKLLATMYNSGRDRSAILLKMLYEEDAFELDDLNQQLGEHARNFLRARENLFALPLSYKERQILNRQRLGIMKSAPLQAKVAELFIQGRRDEGKKHLYEKAIPAQIDVFEEIRLTSEEYEDKSHMFIDRINKDFEENSKIFQLLALLLAISSIVVIYAVMTRISRQEEKKLKNALDQARASTLNAKEHEQYLQAVMDNIGDGIITINHKGMITSFNPKAEQIFGYSEDEIMGSNTSILMPEALRKEHEGYTDNSTISESRIINRDRDLEGRRKDGSYFPMQLHVAPLMIRNERSFVGVLSDISERVQTEKSLRSAKKMEAVGQLTGGIAHDFNNILSVIFGNLYLLKREIQVDGKANELAANIKKSSDRAADLIKQLLGFSRNKVEQEITSDINQLITGMSELIECSITTEIEVERHLKESLWLTMIDPGDFQDVLLNLVINARDAMAGHGKLILETANVTLDAEYCARHAIGTPGQYVKLTVTDNGPGIPSEVLERIFDPFFTTKEVGEGTGLGLAMVYGFIQRSAGHIHVDSARNSGASFQLYLPRSKEQTKADNMTRQESDLLPSGSEVILIVDDDETLLETTRKLLQLQGYKVITAADGQLALEILAKEGDIGLLFSDVVMPGGLNGYQLAEQATVAQPDLKVLLTSGYSKHTQKAHVGNIQAKYTDRLLMKPYTAMELAQRIRTTLDTRN